MFDYDIRSGGYLSWFLFDGHRNMLIKRLELRHHLFVQRIYCLPYSSSWCPYCPCQDTITHTNILTFLCRRTDVGKEAMDRRWWLRHDYSFHRREKMWVDTHARDFVNDENYFWESTWQCYRNRESGCPPMNVLAQLSKLSGNAVWHTCYLNRSRGIYMLVVYVTVSTNMIFYGHHSLSITAVFKTK